MDTKERRRMDTNIPTTDTRLDKLAEVAVRVGLNLAEGQELVMTAGVDSLKLARKIAEAAYKAGASQVTTILGDDQMALARYKYARDESFDYAPAWMFEGMAAAYRSGAARLAIVGDDPNLLAGQDPEKIARANRARSKAYRPALELITASAINWTLVPFANAAWARTVFPDVAEDVAVAKLWDALFAATRTDLPDPAGAWAAHNATLLAKRDILTGHNFRALRFTGPGTDLKVGLADGHAWMGGISTAKNGISSNPNIPTEEVFTTPHAAMTEKMIGTDEGARQLGEVALVPHSSPISQSGLLFFNTLFDENAASHIALGQAYKKCFVNSKTLTDEQFTAAGGNSSLIHVDWMIGSASVDVDGLDAAGNTTPVMRKGEWAL
jgi:aminopeptidase